MNKLSQLGRIAYLKLCYADLQSDMAQRIMFSIIPHLADPSQVALTEGVVDTRALKAAVEGRKNIIKYGVKAVLDELVNYSHTKRPHPSTAASRLVMQGDPEKAMDLAIETFKDASGWFTGYGGRAWEMIARTIRQIIRLDNQLDIIRQSSHSADMQQKEIQVMRDLVVEMNVFDGLAHNSDSILSNLVNLEADDQVKDPMDHRSVSGENYQKIKRLMDAKELESPTEVFKQIRDTLTGSGDIGKFKDWVTKLRGKQEFFQKDPKLAQKLFMIYIRKALITARGKLNSMRDIVSASIKDIETEWSTNSFAKLTADIEELNGEIQIASDEFDENKKYFFAQYPELMGDIAIINSIVEKPKEKAKQLRSHSQRLINQLYQLSNGESNKEQLINICKEFLSVSNQFSYLLDSI